MKNVLLLTDFSTKSENAHHYACQLLTGQSCHFYFLSIQKIWEYTMDDLMVATYKSSLDDALLGDNRLMNNQAISEFEKQYSHEDYTFHGLVDYDDFIHSVNEASTTYDIDFIVIGTDGKTGIIESIFSSHTLRLARHVNKPVLIIPEDFPYREPKKIQYLLDYDDRFEECGKNLLKELVTQFQSRLHFYRLTFGEDFDYLQIDDEKNKIQQIFNDPEIRYQTFIDANPKKILLDSFINELPELLVLSAQKLTFLERLFSNSHLSQVVNTATIPLLILRDCEK